MREEPDFRPAAYALIAAGCGLTFVAAVVPHYSAGYRLQLDVLLIGLLPYLVYACFTGLLRGWPLLVAGLLLVLGDLAVKIPERFLHDGGYQNGLVYGWPLVAGLVVLPLWLGAAVWIHWRRRPPQ